MATGVEVRLRRKDPLRVRRFVAAAKVTAPEPYDPVRAAPYDWEEAGTRELMTGGPCRL
ncbi:MAG: hypothetical protein ABR592_13095 [Nitriliruptorales bacterium]